MHRLASGRCNVGDAARMAGISERQFERRSLDWAGVSPKALARISRFQRAIQKHRAGQHQAGCRSLMRLATTTRCTWFETFTI